MEYNNIKRHILLFYSTLLPHKLTHNFTASEVSNKKYDSTVAIDRMISKRQNLLIFIPNITKHVYNLYDYEFFL